MSTTKAHKDLWYDSRWPSFNPTVSEGTSSKSFVSMLIIYLRI